MSIEDEGFRRTNFPFPLERSLLEMDVDQSRVTLAVETEGVLWLVAVSPWGVDANRVREGIGQLIVGEWRILGGRLPAGTSLVEVRAGDDGAAPPVKRDNLVWLCAVPARQAVEIVFRASRSRELGTARFDPWEEPRVPRKFCLSVGREASSEKNEASPELCPIRAKLG